MPSFSIHLNILLYSLVSILKKWANDNNYSKIFKLIQIHVSISIPYLELIIKFLKTYLMLVRR